MRFVGVNGIGTNGAGNIDLLLARLRKRGFETVDVRLKWRHFITASWGAKRDAYDIVKNSRDGDIVVAHSYGALRTYRAHFLRKYKAILCIAPAMEPDEQWRDPSIVHSFYSKSDWAIRIGSAIPGHPFGPAGLRGFDQPGTTNHEFAV